MVVGLAMFAFYRDAEAALTTITNTLYPGRRSSPAGGYSILALFSHFFSFWEHDRRFPVPELFGNICECAGFFWLAPVTLLALRGVKGEAEKKLASWILMAFGALLFIWMTLPVPHAIGRALFMDKVGAGRCIHVLGLVNVALVALSLSFHRIHAGRDWRCEASSWAPRSSRRCLPRVAADEQPSRQLSHDARACHGNELTPRF